jgi:hypothetical protein
MPIARGDQNPPLLATGTAVARWTGGIYVVPEDEGFEVAEGLDVGTEVVEVVEVVVEVVVVVVEPDEGALV